MGQNLQLSGQLRRWAEDMMVFSLLYVLDTRQIKVIHDIYFYSQGGRRVLEAIEWRVSGPDRDICQAQGAHTECSHRVQYRGTL